VLGGGGIRHGRTPGGLGHDGRAAAIALRRGAPWRIPPPKVGGAPLPTEDTRSTSLQQMAPTVPPRCSDALPAMACLLCGVPQYH
jgi:hypothetical protein